MASIDWNIDDYEASQPRTAIPAGKYLAIIADTIEKVSKNGDKYIELKLQIVHGEYQNYELTDRLNLWHPNEQPRNISRGTLNAISKAVGVSKATDTQQLCNKPLVITVAVEDNTYNGNTTKQNSVKGYSKREQQQAPPQAPPPQQYTQGQPW
jgi:hypothetical protein